MLTPTLGRRAVANNVRVRQSFYNSPHLKRRMGAGTPIYDNPFSYSFRLKGFILGCLIILFSAALLSTELGRIYKGSINRGRNDSNGTFQYLISPNVVVGFNGYILNPKPENRWIWPWSTATLLFSLIMLITGALGIASGVRQSYPIILTFFICLLLSICLLVFVIATYATILAGWKETYGTDRNSMPSFVRFDKDFASGCLAISCALFILLLISLVLSGRTIDVCRPKDYSSSNRNYAPLSAINTPILGSRTPKTPHTPRRPHFNPS